MRSHLKANPGIAVRPGLLVVTVLLLGLAAVPGPSVSAATDPCPNAAVRAQQGSQYLPDCRAFEQVSPVDKSGYNAHASSAQVCAGGDGFGFESGPSEAFANSQGNRVNVYRALRAGPSWETEALTPPSTFASPSLFNGKPNPIGFSADCSSWLLATTDSYDPADTNTGLNNNDIYRQNPDGSLTWMTRGSGNGDQLGGQLFQGATSDLSRIYFRGKDSLDPAHPLPPGFSGSALYMSEGGTPQVVGLLPDGRVDGGKPRWATRSSTGTVDFRRTPWPRTAADSSFRGLTCRTASQCDRST